MGHPPEPSCLFCLSCCAFFSCCCEARKLMIVVGATRRSAGRLRRTAAVRKAVGARTMTYEGRRAPREEKP